MPAPGTQLPVVARAAFTAQVFSLSGVYSLKNPCTRKSCAGQAAWGLGLLWSKGHDSLGNKEPCHFFMGLSQTDMQNK